MSSQLKYCSLQFVPSVELAYLTLKLRKHFLYTSTSLPLPLLVGPFGFDWWKLEIDSSWKLEIIGNRGLLLLSLSHFPKNLGKGWKSEVEKQERAVWKKLNDRLIESAVEASKYFCKCGEKSRYSLYFRSSIHVKSVIWAFPRSIFYFLGLISSLDFTAGRESF